MKNKKLRLARKLLMTSVGNAVFVVKKPNKQSLSLTQFICAKNTVSDAISMRLKNILSLNCGLILLRKRGDLNEA